MPHAVGVVREAGAEIFIVDETFVDAPPERVAEVLLHPDNVATAWPHVSLTREGDGEAPRGGRLLTWAVSGVVEGRFELWLEPFWEGAIVHHYVRGRVAPGAARRVERAHVARWKRHVTAVKDALEAPRAQWHLGGGESVRSRREASPLR